MFSEAGGLRLQLLPQLEEILVALDLQEDLLLEENDQLDHTENPAMSPNPMTRWPNSHRSDHHPTIHRRSPH